MRGPCSAAQHCGGGSGGGGAAAAPLSVTGGGALLALDSVAGAPIGVDAASLHGSLRIEAGAVIAAPSGGAVTLDSGEILEAPVLLSTVPAHTFSTLPIEFAQNLAATLDSIVTEVRGAAA